MPRPNGLTGSPNLMKDLKELAHLQILDTTKNSGNEFSL